MPIKTEPKRFRIHLFFLLASLVGLSLILGGTPSYGQAQKTLIDLNTASEKDLESIKGVGPATAKKIIAGRPYTSVEDLKKAGIPEKTIESMKPQVKVGTAQSPAKPSAEVKPAAPAKPTIPPKPTAPPAPAKEMAKEAPAKLVPVKETPAPAASTATPQKGTTPASPAAKSPTKAAAPAPAKQLAPGQKVNINTATKEQLEALPEVGPVKAQAIIDGRPYKKTEDVMKVKGIKEGTFGKIKDMIIVD
jgi:competence protein ComEA